MGEIVNWCIGIAALVMLFVVALVFRGYILLRRKERAEKYKPVVLVCVVNGRVGVVLRDDYERASRETWQPYEEGKRDYDWGHTMAPYGRRLNVTPTFVFNAHSSEVYEALVAKCYVEQGMFQIPPVPEAELNPLAKAYEHLCRRPLPSHLVK